MTSSSMRPDTLCARAGEQLERRVGGVESLICFPSETSHAKMSPGDRRARGISDTLIRFSAGIEDVENLMEDMDRGFAAARR